MLKNKIFYNVKPFIPRWLQIFVRRLLIAHKLKKYTHVWPIDPNGGTPPEGWKGWPGNKIFTVILSHDVDTQKGHDQCYLLMDIEERMGFRSSFNFVAEKYHVSRKLIEDIKKRGFEVCVHGLVHDGKLFSSKRIFKQRTERINEYLKEWGAMGFTSPSMHHNLDWMHVMNISHSTSTFDTDPFEPQNEALGTIFPLWVENCVREKGFVELPYTLPQDFTLFVLMKEKNIRIWTDKLHWISEKGGMALFNSHPDYMNFNKQKRGSLEYDIELYTQFLEHIKSRYEGQYWHVLPREIARFWKQNYSL